MAMTERERRHNMFYRANNGNKKAQAKILKDNLFDEWVSWNVGARNRLDACNFACQEMSRMRIPHRDNQVFDDIIAQYEAGAAKRVVEMTERMANACMDLLFGETVRS
ncbi:MAG: hypothetical protein WB780_12970 [Candidatus Acidiferrales bacterium]